MNKSIAIILSLFVISGCFSQKPTEIPAPPKTSTIEATPPATAAPASRSLTICLGDEPNTLYPYGGLNAAARSVLSAIYDGPIDVQEYGYEPIILEKIPTLEDGDAQLTKVTVQAGDQIVAADGNVTASSRDWNLDRADAAPTPARSNTTGSVKCKWINWSSRLPC